MNSKTGRWVLAGSAAAIFLLPACGDGGKEVKHAIKEPVTIAEVADGEFARVTLTERAAERLDIQTVLVEEVAGLRFVPSGAVIVDAGGGRAVYTNPQPLVYLRQSVTVAHERGGRAYLSEGPATGTRIVTIGAAELHGAETGIGK